MQLSTPIEEISRVGPQYQKKLKKLGIKTVSDLLYHFPHRYEDFSNIIPIRDAKLGETVCVRGKILEIENTRTWKKRMILTQALISDETSTIRVIWFNQPYLTNVLKERENVVLAGKMLTGEKGLYLSNPVYEKFSEKETLTHLGRLVPVYPETEGLSSRWLRSILKPLLFHFKNKLQDPLPEDILKKNRFLPLSIAIWQVHFPNSMNLAQKAMERFSFEELFFIELFVLTERIKLAKTISPAVSISLKIIQKFINSLPFKLTPAQKKCAWQILKDMEKSRPMNRLLEGDVGSGKTVVAAIAALNAARAGYQVAFMAPTEILAKQHFREIANLLANFKLDIALLTGQEEKIISKNLKREIKKISRQKILEKSLAGKIKILIGTHALIQDQVRFNNLALVIVDEQHRFGVEQRAKLTKQKMVPHLLSMTATPIPRTLALTLYGDLDLSIIDQLPQGRKKIITKVIEPKERQKTYNFIGQQVKKGRQVFVICPRIEPPTNFQENNFRQTKSTKSGGGLSWAEVKAVKDEYEKLSKKVFPDFTVEMLHGKMKTKEKEKIMRNFKNKKIDILVSTSVVEVGIDVPNATVMMIEGTERFGLAQLHQFRGRVGRSDFQSYCFLFTDSPARKTAQRLSALISAENGFELSEKDLEIRGPGQLTGSQQWGIPDLAMSSLKNIKLVEKTREEAKKILTEDWQLKRYPLLRKKLEEFRIKIHLE